MVSDAELLAEQVSKHPLDMVLRSALVDELYATNCDTFEDAQHRALLVARGGNDASNLAMGAKLSQVSKPWHEPLLWAMALTAKVNYHFVRNVYLAPGFTFPVGIPIDSSSAVGNEVFDISVGAEWVITAVQGLVDKTPHKRRVARIIKGYVLSFQIV